MLAVLILCAALVKKKRRRRRRRVQFGATTFARGEGESKQAAATHPRIGYDRITDKINKIKCFLHDLALL